LPGLACLKALLEGHTQTQIWDAGTNIVRFVERLRPRKLLLKYGGTQKRKKLLDAYAEELSVKRLE
jgi:hypothetical protein